MDGTTKNTLEYEIVQVVDTGPVLRDMAFSVDHEHLYIMSEKQVRNPIRPRCWEIFWLGHATDGRIWPEILRVKTAPTKDPCAVLKI